MSDKVSLWAAIQANWGQITVIGGGIVLLHLFVMGVMVNMAVTAKLGAQDLATDSNIMLMNDEIDENGAAAAGALAHSVANTARIAGNERRVEQAFGVLVGRSVPGDD